MNNYQKILQYHLDNNLKKVSPKHNSGLSPAEVKKLQLVLDIQTQAMGLRAKPSRGKHALSQTLKAIDTTPNRPSSLAAKLWPSRLRLTTSVLAVFVVFMMAGGLAIFNSRGPADPLSSVALKANGTVDNLHNLNLADAENDISNSATDNAATQQAEAKLSNESNLDEVINAGN